MSGQPAKVTLLQEANLRTSMGSDGIGESVHTMVVTTCSAAHAEFFCAGTTRVQCCWSGILWSECGHRVSAHVGCRGGVWNAASAGAAYHTGGAIYRGGGAYHRGGVYHAGGTSVTHGGTTVHTGHTTVHAGHTAVHHRR